ncbi:ThuA domain-containing protein [Amycolatopsis carbonis]|uniref:ThuA domain-containing protein n=1 Tax=Amycolatopsis carbonis TaxID=715471 RepID=A0A9Y2MRI7_9PSEU|nr:ThuA domain-containing protein [Amycolatopsis sp. 2-15]WIX75521.1 ThuA domain-containing protein [Amycolatopsis sp. 2-15]
MKRRSATVLTALASASAAALATVLAYGMPASAHDGGGRTGAQQLGDPQYGVCRGLDSGCYHNWGNFDLSKGIKVLVYSRTAGPRHANLGPALGPGLNPPLADANVAQKALVKLGQQNGFAVDWTEDVTQLASPNTLFKYNAVIFLSTSRDALDDSAQTSLRQYIRGGGGFVAIHNAFGTEYNWPWYEGLLGGTNYYDHGPAQAGTVQTVERNDVSTKNLPNRWAFTDEWYNLDPFPSNVRFLAKVDESSLAQGVTGSMGHPGHGANHPVAWCQYYDGGRSWVTTLGHEDWAFTNTSTSDGARYFQSLIVGGIKSAAGAAPFCR